jgi:transposase
MKTMGARLRAYLNPEEDRTLFELRRGSTVPQRVKDRAEVVRLSHQGWYVEKIASFFHWNPQTVRETLYRWQKQGLGGLFEASGRGQQRRWSEADIQYLEECLRQEPRSYNAQQLADKLDRERPVKLSSGHLRGMLKKKG